MHQDGTTPSPAVEILGVVYRLICRRGTAEPAVDYLGNYLYMPVLPCVAAPNNVDGGSAVQADFRREGEAAE